MTPVTIAYPIRDTIRVTATCCRCGALVYKSNDWYHDGTDSIYCSPKEVHHT